MHENIFFDTKKIKHVGKNVIIGKTVRIRYPELVSIGDNCIIDDFTYISTALELEGYNHISAGCKIIGGPNSKLHMKKFSTFSPNVVIAAGSDDYDGGIATPLVPVKYKGNVKYGDIIIGEHVIVGSGCVVLPEVEIGEGSTIGALSLVNKDTGKWGIYAGIPIRKLKNRNKDKVKQLVDEYYKSNPHG